MRLILSGLLLAHGIAHLVGFAVAWKLLVNDEVPYRTTLFAGAVSIGDASVRLVGILWLVVALAFVVVAVGLLMRTSWATPAMLVLVASSTVMCVAGWPDARLGLAANALIAALLLVNTRSAGLTF